MATGRTFVHCLIFMVSYGIVVQANSSPELVTIDAAMQFPLYSEFLVLFNNGRGLYIPTAGESPDEWYKESNIQDLTSLLLRNITPKAGIMRLNEKGMQEMVLYGKNKLQVGYLDRKFYNYGSDYDFIKDGGPDGAARRGDGIIFFKGCKMAFKHKSGEWDNPEDVTALGLPCNVDAAWDAENTTIILRGNRIWRWKEDNSVDGPHPFHDIYTITSWILKPYKASCPDGWHMYETTYTCYGLFKDKKSWVAARKACQAQGGDLVTIKDKFILDFVNEFVKKDFAYYWLGLNDVKKEGTFVWLDETEKATFTRWYTNEPNDYHGEDCGHITEKTKLRWNDLGCEAKIGYICERPAIEE